MNNRPLDGILNGTEIADAMIEAMKSGGIDHREVFVTASLRRSDGERISRKGKTTKLA